MSAQEPLAEDVVETLDRCAAAGEDLPRLRDELHALRVSSDPRAQFATSLFDLERARRGDAEAREQLGNIADSLLIFWREGSGDELAALHPALGPMWARAASLLVDFDRRQFAAALATCFEVRKDGEQLAAAINTLRPEGDRRVEFARCLYHLELARMMVEGSRAEFARRAGLLAEAWQDADVARQLVGDDAGLAELWAELVPYLDEFFETLEEAAERQRQEGQRAEAKTDPGVPLGSDRRIPSFRTLTGQREGVITRPEAPAALPDATPRETPVFVPESDTGETLLEGDVLEEPVMPPPPPPPYLTPPGASGPISEVELIGEEIVDFTPIPPPPPPPNFTPARGVAAASADVLDAEDVEEAPDELTLSFWTHTFDQLKLLPDDETGRGARLLSCESRADRKRLNGYLDSLGQYGLVEESKAMSALIRLMLAGQTKEKTLFGQANPRRSEAMGAALPFLASSAQAAGHAAVWFELDGPETQEALNRGLELLQDYLTFCARIQKDPLHPDTIGAYVSR